MSNDQALSGKGKVMAKVTKDAPFYFLIGMGNFVVVRIRGRFSCIAQEKKRFFCLLSMYLIIIIENLSD